MLNLPSSFLVSSPVTMEGSGEEKRGKTSKTRPGKPGRGEPRCTKADRRYPAVPRQACRCRPPLPPQLSPSRRVGKEGEERKALPSARFAAKKATHVGTSKPADANLSARADPYLAPFGASSAFLFLLEGSFEWSGGEKAANGPAHSAPRAALSTTTDLV